MSDKKWKASMVVEASYLVPYTLMLYAMLILLAITLLQRCLTSQNYFLENFENSRQAMIQEGYGEVIYGKRNV